jgi:hypothetical protein
VSAVVRLALEFAAAWLMPTRAARAVRDVSGDWWNLPRPVAVAAAALMPWRAVAELRSHQRAFLRVTGGLVAAHRRYGLASPGPRHLRAVALPGDEVPYTGRHLKSVPRLSRQ